jgi:hypothetical protein
VFTNRVENGNALGPQSHGVGPCSEGWLKLEKSALQSTRWTPACPALRRCPAYTIQSLYFPELRQHLDAVGSAEIQHLRLNHRQVDDSRFQDPRAWRENRELNIAEWEPIN